MRNYPRVTLTGLLLVVVLLASGLPLGGRAAEQPAQLPWQDKGQPFGVVATLGNRVRDDDLNAAISLLRESGAQWQREEIFWHSVQTQPDGPFTWTGDGAGFYNYDRAIGAQVAAGVNVLGLLDYNPAWFKGQNPTLDQWIDDWGDFVYAAVARYGRDRGWIKHWELWNEPNLAHSGYESGLYTVADFVRILEVGRAAALAADPEARIVMGGLASIWSEPPSPYHYDYPDYLAQVAALGGWNHVDILAIHPYRPDAPEGDTWRRDHSQNLSQELARLDHLLYTYGPKPIWLTELGWTSSSTWPGVDEDTQAFFLVRSYVLALAHPSVEKVFWYDFRDDTAPNADYTRPVYNHAETQFHYGLLRRHYPLDPGRGDLRKPAFLAFRTMTATLGGLTLQQPLLQGDDPAHPGIYWYRFASADRRVDLLWRTLDAGSRLTVTCDCNEALVRGWNGAVLHVLYPDPVAGTLDLTVPATGAPFYVEYDPPVRPYGRRFEATGHTLSGAFATFWSSHGGIERFGYPLTEELIEPQAGHGQPRTVQYFERARFEHFPEHSGTAAEVQLGRLGEAALLRQGVEWQSLPPIAAAPPHCRHFAETARTLCPPFLAMWEQAGGLAMVGYPLTEAFPLDDGQRFVQYFERTRLEYAVPQNGDPAVVEFGLLGRELLTRTGGMP